MTRKLVSSGSSFETDIGYSRAVVDGDWIFVSGTTGFDYTTMTISDDVVTQCRQAMRNIASALAQADASIADVVRVRYILPRREDFEPCWPVLKEYLGSVRPAATMIQAGLSDPRMKIEIEVTARRSRSPRVENRGARLIVGRRSRNLRGVSSPPAPARSPPAWRSCRDRRRWSIR